MTILTVISAGLSSPSSSIELGMLIAQPVLAMHPEMSLQAVEVKDIAHDLVDFMTNGGYRSTRLEQITTIVSQSDALIVVTPVFQASYSGMFKMFFDSMPRDAIKNTPVILAANAGSQRHVLVLDHALRPLFSFLKARIVPTGIVVTPADRREQAWPRIIDRINRASQELDAMLLTT